MNRNLLRALAFVGAVLLPLLWLASLAGVPAHQTANYFRVIGALFGAGAGWIILSFRGDPVSWRTCLGGGVAGSLTVSAISIVVPALGPFAASGWLMSGVVGGGMVTLLLFAWRGEL